VVRVFHLLREKFPPQAQFFDLLKSFLLTAKNLRHSGYYDLSTILFFKGSVRYTHELTGLNLYNIQNNLFFACGTFNKRKIHPIGTWMIQNDGKIHLLLWVEILSLKSYFSAFLLIYSTLK